jgi:hypothetical protein
MSVGSRAQLVLEADNRVVICMLYLDTVYQKPDSNESSGSIKYLEVLEQLSN